MDFASLCAHRFEQVQILRDEAVGLLAFVAIHDTRLGPAFGGIRRQPYRSALDALDDALRLAEAMTLKCAVAGIPGGGGKTVIVDSPGLDRVQVYRRVGRFVEQMGGRYYTGPDVGTSPDDLVEVARATGFVASPELCGNLAEPTAEGVVAAIEVVAARLETPLAELRVAVQGLGEVGCRLAALLAERGAHLLVADLREDHAREVAERLGALAVDAVSVLSVDADVLAPCALGGVVDVERAAELRVRAVVGSANNVLADPEAGRVLFERGVLYAPDFVVNAGALVSGALCHLEGRQPDLARVREIGARLGAILDESHSTGQPPEVVALRLARERLATAPAEPFWPREGAA
jgi:glutamate dehydrogenase/leucine dehydrogenase